MLLAVIQKTCSGFFSPFNLNAARAGEIFFLTDSAGCALTKFAAVTITRISSSHRINTSYNFFLKVKERLSRQRLTSQIAFCERASPLLLEIFHIDSGEWVKKSASATVLPF